MLHVVRDHLLHEYYDSTFHGMDLTATVARAESLIQLASSNSEIFEIIAKVVVALDDSHTRFIPPGRVTTVEYGWSLQMIGDSGFVVLVDSGSDAAAKGVIAGDRIVAVDGWVPNRRDIRLFRYYYDALNPHGTVRLALESPAGVQRVVDVAARFHEGTRIVDVTGADRHTLEREQEGARRRWRDRFSEYGDVLVWRMGRFGDEAQMDAGVKRARQWKTLILDLRGNPGGLLSAWTRLASYMVERDAIVGETQHRNRREPIIVKPRTPSFRGKLIVLTDSRSASASELFARFIQQQQRGLVVGDRSAGLVLTSHFYWHQLGRDIVIPYGVQISISDVVMADGLRLERVGVLPDIRVVPTGADLATAADPVLAHAMSMAGHPMDAATAGRLLPRDERRWD